MPATFTIKDLSRQLGLDVRYLARALAGILPDEMHGARKRWMLSTVKAAVERHGHTLAGGHYNGSRAADDGLVELERSAIDLQGALDKLAAIKNPEARRTGAKDVGVLLVRFQQALDNSATTLPPGLRELTAPARSEILGQAIGQALATLHLQIAD